MLILLLNSWRTLYLFYLFLAHTPSTKYPRYPSTLAQRTQAFKKIKDPGTCISDLFLSFGHIAVFRPTSLLCAQDSLLMVLRGHMCVVPEVKSRMAACKAYPPSALSSVFWNMYFQEDPKEILNGRLTSTQTRGGGNLHQYTE